jgi:hypothetical protein
MTRTLPKAQWVAIGVAAALAIGTVALSGRGQPSPQSVIGGYASPCCGELLIAADSLTYGEHQSALRFYHMKFGLTAYAVEPLGPFYKINGATREAPTLYFDGPNEFSITGYKGQVAHFTRVR